MKQKKFQLKREGENMRKYEELIPKTILKELESNYMWDTRGADTIVRDTINAVISFIDMRGSMTLESRIDELQQLNEECGG